MPSCAAALLAATRKAPLHATPPATIKVLGPYSSATRSVVPTKERITTFWKLAARSLIACDGASPFWTGSTPLSRTYFVTAVFRPLKLKSGGPSLCTCPAPERKTDWCGRRKQPTPAPDIQRADFQRRRNRCGLQCGLLR